LSDRPSRTHASSRETDSDPQNGAEAKDSRQAQDSGEAHADRHRHHQAFVRRKRTQYLASRKPTFRRSLAADRRQHSARVVNPGEGNKGD
jgi:hypothetical protein